MRTQLKKYCDIPQYIDSKSQVQKNNHIKPTTWQSVYHKKKIYLKAQLHTITHSTLQILT